MPTITHCSQNKICISNQLVSAAWLTSVKKQNRKIFQDAFISSQQHECTLCTISCSPKQNNHTEFPFNTTPYTGWTLQNHGTKNKWNIKKKQTNKQYDLKGKPIYCFAKLQREKAINFHESLMHNAAVRSTLRFPPSSGVGHSKEEHLLQVLVGLKSLWLKNMSVYVNISIKVVSQRRAILKWMSMVI